MIVFFNIDGQRFSINDKTISKYKESLLYEAYANQKTNDFIAIHNGEIYIDMDPINFNHIIKMLRGYKVALHEELIDDIKKLKLDVLLTPKVQAAAVSETSTIGRSLFLQDTNNKPNTNISNTNIFSKKQTHPNPTDSTITELPEDILNTMTNQNSVSRKTLRPKKIELN